jgi:hypothetical protein
MYCSGSPPTLACFRTPTATFSPAHLCRLLLQELQGELKLAKAGKPSKDGRALKEDVVRNKLDKKQQQLQKAEIQAKVGGRV